MTDKTPRNKKLHEDLDWERPLSAEDKTYLRGSRKFHRELGAR